METIQYPTEIKAIKEHTCDFCLGKIEKNSRYIKSVYKHDYIYTWRTHIHCSEIASKLKMYDNCDIGLTTNDFNECINEEYDNIMSNTQNELYEDKSFVIPKFQERLQFVLSYHRI